MPSLEDNTTQVGAHADNRQIISMKSQGFCQTPQDIMEVYNGCSVPQYTAYGRVRDVQQRISIANHSSNITHSEFEYASLYH